MKKYLLSCLILLAAFLTTAQNYRCLQPGVKNFFTNSDGYLRGIRIDSVKTYADSTVFYPFRTSRGTYDTGPSGHTITTTDPVGGCWLGKKVIELADGTTIFDDLWGDSLIIKTQANAGDSWTMYNDSGSVYYTATVTNEDTLTVLSTLDSAKYIKINAFNGTGPLTSDPLDNLVITLTKNHGFAQVVDLYTFPYHKADSSYRAGLDYFLDRPMDLYSPPIAFDLNKMTFRIVNFINPNDQQMYNWDIGNIIESLQSCGNMIYGPYDAKYFHTTIDTKTTTGHVVTYSLSGVTTNPSCPPSSTYPNVSINRSGPRSFNDTVYTILKQSSMPEGYGNVSFILYYPDDNSNCYSAPAYSLKPVNYNRGLGGFSESFNYKLGIGLVHHNYADGEPTFESSQLTYFKSSAITCGTPVATPNLNTLQWSVSISPNPSTDELNIKREGSEPYTISVQNLLGQVVRTVQTTQKEDTINVSNLAPGMYIVNITDEQGNKSSHKVIIQH